MERGRGRTDDFASKVLDGVVRVFDCEGVENTCYPSSVCGRMGGWQGKRVVVTANSTFRPIPLLRHRQRLAVNQQPAVRKGSPVSRPGHRRPLHRQGEAGQALLRVDRHAVLGKAAVHDADEPIGFALVGGDEHEVVDQAQEQAVIFALLQERQVVPLEVGVEVVAERGREDGALWDAGLLAVVLLADADEVLFDVGGGEGEEVAGGVSFLDGAADEDGIFLFGCEGGFDPLQEGPAVVVGFGDRVPPLGCFSIRFVARS